jgi:membrane associated rhomboid family serine protease
MSRFWNQFLAALTPGVRILLAVLTATALAAFIAQATGAFNLDGWLERVRSRAELWIICSVSAAGAGLAAVLLPFAPLSGAGPMMFGLLAAWYFHCGHEKVSVFPFGEMTVRQVALVAAAVSLLFTAFSAGWQTATAMAADGLSGWLYVWGWHKWLMSRASRVVPSERISRLEL